MFGLGPLELVVILIVALLIFGNRLPSLMRSLGKSVVEFKKGLKDGEAEPPKPLEGGNKPQLPPGPSSPS
ncbi:MAG: twin-arginine translocase TatA/TatE family subunit [Planctomycetes bacterium]|nr:twin-arginine translocase TatA/TatE family subunit [Planctomycetota bacterium]MBM4086698.1 twin-arginine translocase TatA/TatE family subunit [Planctomycetota bacterium]